MENDPNAKWLFLILWRTDMLACVILYLTGVICDEVWILLKHFYKIHLSLLWHLPIGSVPNLCYLAGSDYLINWGIFFFPSKRIIYLSIGSLFHTLKYSQNRHAISNLTSISKETFTTKTFTINIHVMWCLHLVIKQTQLCKTSVSQDNHKAT